MATIERIEQDIKALEQTVTGIAQSLQDSYTAYFAALGRAVRQQLILATYHLCTQGYPNSFLQLSLSQRQKLQQSIRELGTKTADQLQKYTLIEAETVTNTDILEQDTAQHQTGDEKGVDEKESESEISSETIPLSLIELLASEGSPFDIEELNELEEYDEYEDEEFEDEDEDEDEDEEDTKYSSENQQSQPQKEPKNKNIDKKAIPRLPNIPIFPLINPVPLRFAAINIANPIEISKWIHSLEISTQFALKKLSRETNMLLQKAEILPKKLPEPVIEAAAASEGAEVLPGPPNVLNVVVEVSNERRPTDSGLTQIMTVNLRLTEIEFADSQVSAVRKQIHILQGQLQKLRREYFKKQRELAVAQAEAAWRSSWFDES